MSSSYKGGAPQAPWWRAARGNAFVQWRMRQCRRRTWSSLLAVLLLAGAVALPAAAQQCAILNCDFIQWRNGADATGYTTSAIDVSLNVGMPVGSHPKQLNQARGIAPSDPQPTADSRTLAIAAQRPDISQSAAGAFVTSTRSTIQTLTA